MAVNSYIDHGILFICLDNIGYGNSFGVEEATELLKVYRNHKKSKELKGVIFRSSKGRVFCSGGNLKFYARNSFRSGMAANRKIRRVLNVISKWPIPTAAVVNGDCFGGGMELASCFDYIVASPHSFFGLWQRRIGLSFGWGGGARLLSRVNRSTLVRLSLEGRSFSALEAKEMGFVDQLALEDQLEKVAIDWIEGQAIWPRKPLRYLKVFNRDNESFIFSRLWGSGEHRAVLRKVK